MTGEGVTYTQEMEEMIALTENVAEAVLGFPVDVSVVKSDATAQAWYGERHVTFNLTRLGDQFFANKGEGGLRKALDVILGQLSHAEEADSVSSLGANLTLTALRGVFNPLRFGYRRLSPYQFPPQEQS